MIIRFSNKLVWTKKGHLIVCRGKGGGVAWGRNGAQSAQKFLHPKKLFNPRVNLLEVEGLVLGVT